MGTYTQLINRQRDYLLGMQLKLSSMLSYTEREMVRLAPLLEELKEMEESSRPSSSETPPLWQRLEKELNKLQDEVGLRDLTVDESMSAAAMRRLIHYFKERGQ